MGQHRRPSQVIERVGRSMRQSSTDDWGGRLPAVPKTVSGAVGQSSQVESGGGDGVKIEHVTLHAVGGQVVASGGAGVAWDRIAGPPTEIRGFATAADRLASTGSIVAIPIDVTGVLNGFVVATYETYRGGGIVTVTLTANGLVEVPVDLDDAEVTSRRAIILLENLEVRSRDTLKIALPNDSGSDTVLSGARMALKILKTSDETSRAQGYYAAVTMLGPVAHWRLGEPSGATAADSTGNGHDGTYNGLHTLGQPPLIADGDPDTAVAFSGGYVQAPDSSDYNFTGTSPYTYLAWVAPTAADTATRAIMGKNARIELQHKGDGSLVKFEGTRDADGSGDGDVAGSGFAYSPGERAFVAYTFDGATMRLYVNGVEVSSSSTVESLPATSGDMFIGAFGASDLGSSSSTTDEVTVLDYALTADQIARLWDIGG